MKRFLLSASAALIALSGISQGVPEYKVSPELRNKTIAIPVHAINNQNPVPAQDIEAQAQRIVRSATETEIGDTRYDLQSNSAVQRRLIVHDNGAISAAWTYSNVNSWATRGTGYNYFNGSTWGTAPTSEIETERTGWPSLMATSGGKEVIIAHSTASNILRQSSRGSIGSGTWSQANLTSLSSQVWNRAVSTGNTIHVVGMSLPTANGGSAYNGMDGAFLYNRSDNGGTSYIVSDYQIPGTDSSQYSGFDGDSYAIDAKGDTVAIVVGGLGTGVQLFKSTNNGQSWTKTDVLLSDVWFEEDETPIDTALNARLYTSDGNVAVLLDEDGMAHVWYGRMFIANADITDGLINYYPGTNGIDYWNETFPGPFGLYLTGALEINGTPGLQLTDWGQYRFSGLANQPNAGIDDDGCIYLAYAALNEDLTNGAQNYRHTYVMKSCDGGCSWSFPIDVTGAGTNDFSECVFPTIARKVNDDVHILYMSDNEPGMAVQGDEDPVAVNKMIYLKEDAERFDTTDICPTGIAGDTFLCAGGDVTIYALGCASAYSWSGPGGFTASTATITATATGTYTVTMTTVCGSQTESINVVEFTGTNGPTVNLTATLNSMCAGDSSTLVANTTIGGLLYQWSANAGSATTQSVTVTSPGTYSVTVTACGGGATVEELTITEPQIGPSAIIDGDLTICSGQTSTLTAFPVSGGSYLWSTGATTQSITISTPGSYSVTVSNCAGNDNTSVTVENEDDPVATIEAPIVEGCEGDQLTATAGGGSSYSWSNGSTSAAISISDPSESGTYTVTVTNDCGGSDEASITLTIHENPAAPNITVDGLNYVSSQTGAGSHQWFVNGNPENETSNTLTGSVDWFGASITCIYTDENGCSSPEASAVLNVSDVKSELGIGIYPNPNNGLFDIQFGDNAENLVIEITDVTGKVVYQSVESNASNTTKNINLSSLESGVYQVSLKNESFNVIESVVIK